MTRDAIVQLIRNGLDDALFIASTVDEGIPGQLLVVDADGDTWTVQVTPR